MKNLKPVLLFIIPLLVLAFVSEKDHEKELKKAYKTLEKQFSNFVFIPGTSYGYPNDSLSINAFYMSKYEVTNLDWRFFVSDVKEKVKGDSFKRLLPDTGLWVSNNYGYNEPMRSYYYSHPSYSNYPVVNISLAQAKTYCKWFQEKLLKTDIGNFKSVLVRIPTEVEWEYAAKGGYDYSKYPWGGPYIRNAKGSYLANFRVIPQDEARKINGKIVLKMDLKNSEGAMMTGPVNMYFANDFGLYQMAGNVAEFVIPSNHRNELDKVLETHGITRGGSFFDPPHYMKCSVRDFYQKDSSANFMRGFRPIISIVAN
ncbi:MAG: SUMF1/EgtB/PvdO family nonheme iron enzyme [Bacteroidia bacterium]